MRHKADQDPAEWLPPTPDALRRYRTGLTAAKLHWGLAVDEAERDRLSAYRLGCTARYARTYTAGCTPHRRDHPTDCRSRVRVPVTPFIR